ncbi:MAG: peptide chain release factor N(5)-glutamine methyltransferase [Verrucomicrobiae bacterium]|nr:peptide chain release factor N(5)-glutamine methyltransferase [Verrucomicrobiae bacterium]MCX7722876.1 peptide chain release factor N(5)-glutamine methyltransferase [Verrucomicrobiae bacterium]MDW7980155.1 peptide chain release factor N(5)-glutamine methyltransferase [Verrucomicrobiales bacterium]
MTVLEVIQKSTEFLAKKGIESPRLQAELLLAHLLKMPRMHLYLNFDRRLSDAELSALREMVKRRAQREPLQYITGSANFCGLELVVNRHVLIPRPETELLAQKGWEFLLNCGVEQPKALDFGTGSGCIAIALAVHCQRAEVWAIDCSEAALGVAKLNAERHGVLDRIRFVASDGFDALPAELRLDLIISNPPYIPSSQIERLQPEVRDYEPRQALDGGHDGLDYFRKLAAGAAPLLKPGGVLMVELGDGAADATRAVFEQRGWIVAGIECDYNGKARILIARPGNAVQA